MLPLIYTKHVIILGSTNTPIYLSNIHLVWLLIFICKMGCGAACIKIDEIVANRLGLSNLSIYA